MIQAEFVGGPWGGRIVRLPDACSRWYVSVQPVISHEAAMATEPPEIALPSALVYHRSYMTFHGTNPNGRHVYVLEGFPDRFERRETLA